MAYKCKNCGKYVSKEALFCMHCGQENPAIFIEQSTSVKCTKNKEHKSSSCQANPLIPAGKSGNNLDMKTLIKVGLLFIAIIVIGIYFARKDDTTPKAAVTEKKDINQFRLEMEENLRRAINEGEEQEDAKDYVVTNATLEERRALSESEYSIVHRWMETYMGTTSKECRIEKIKKNGKYRILTGDIYFTCYPKKITRNSHFVFHNSNLYNGEYFNLAIGTPIYYIPQMETNANGVVNGILVIQADGSAQLYMNDYNPNFYEIFTELRPI